jgi:hypothetical protein
MKDERENSMAVLLMLPAFSNNVNARVSHKTKFKDKQMNMWQG